MARGAARFIFTALAAGCFFLSARVEAQYGGGSLGNAGMGGVGSNAGGGMSNQSGIGFGQSMATGTSGIIGGNRGSLAGWQSYHNYRMVSDGLSASSAGADFARLGPTRMTMSASLGFGVNSNINNSPTNPLSDGIVQASYLVAISWQATRRNLLQLSLGFNLQHYLTYSQYSNNGLLIDPNTGLDYRIYFNDFVLTLYDYPSITNNGGSNDPGIVNSVNFSQLNNSIGFSLLWNPNQLVVLGGFQRQDTLSLTSNAFESQNSTGYSAFGTVSYNVTPTTSTGLRLQASTIAYAQQVLNNSVTTQAGLFLQTRPSAYTTVYFEAGLQSGTYSDTGRQTSTVVYQQTNGVNTNVEGTLGGGNYVQPYFNLQITNRLNRYMTHSLMFARSASGSSVSNYQEMYTVSYQLQYRLNRVTTLSMNANYQLGKISSGTSSNGSSASAASVISPQPVDATLAGASSNSTTSNSTFSNSSTSNRTLATSTSSNSTLVTSSPPITSSSNGLSSVPYSNWGAGLTLSFEAMKHTTLGISYNYYSSNMPSMSGSYTQQILAFTITHQF